jgi:hypothetical protein
MANTIIKIKQSSTTAVPANGSLSAAEQAYSFLTNKLFIGNAAGDGVIEIGGQYWIDQTIEAFNQANAAFQAANTGNNEAVFSQANTARTHANAAYEQANAANVLAFNSAIAANAYADSVGTAGNNYTITVGAASNNWANTVATYANTYADAVGAAANTYANATFVKLNDGNQTITGDINITGNLFVTGNTTTIGSQDLVIEDPIFIIANNNITDIVDIGFVAHYANATSDQVHTGLIRDPGTKQWYLFKEYNDHFFYSGGNIDLGANNFTIDTLNANFVTSNLILGGANAIVTIGAAFNKANAANVLAFNTGIGANAWANTISSTRAAAANGWANTISNTRATASNTYAASVGAAANTNAANGSYISAGIVKVPYGGTGMTTFTQNGVLFGNTAGDLKVTAAGTEGQVLQASASGVPLFGDIDGGAF